MNIQPILVEIDAEIARLSQARQLLAVGIIKQSGGGSQPKRTLGRPKGSKNTIRVGVAPVSLGSQKNPDGLMGGKAAFVRSQPQPTPAQMNGNPKSTITPEGRKRLSLAMKRRWRNKRRDEAAAAVENA